MGGRYPFPPATELVNGEYLPLKVGQIARNVS
jgi:hypothetical protein